MPQSTLTDSRLSASKMPKASDMAVVKKHQRKRFHNQMVQDSLRTTLGNDTSSEKDDASMQLPIYDKLLRSLGSGSNVIADFYSRRQQGGIGDSDDDDGADFKITSASKEEVDEGVEYCLKDDVNPRAHLCDDIRSEVGGEETGLVEEASDQYDVSDSDAEGQGLADEMENSSSFHQHFGYSLAKEEVNKLMNQKTKFTWEMPANEMAMSKLVGTGQDLTAELNGDPFCGINSKLYNLWKDSFSSFNSGDALSSKRRLFFSLCNTYRDIMYCDKKPFYMKGKEDDSSIMDAYIMHALNHVYITRDIVIKSDAQLSKHENSKMKEIIQGGIYLDQGFTRPKVMFLLPLASIAFRVVKRLVQLAPVSQKGNMAHMDRFSEDFGTGDIEGDDNTDASFHPQKRAKPTDFEALFGGNNNDHFMIGMKFTKRSIKIYSNFYSSDIIVASPLGLITRIGEAELEKEKDVDYLSSIEVLIIDHADVITMQNWSHVNTLVEQLNHVPSTQHGTDMMRIKQWYLDGHARHYRQTILLGSFLSPDMNALFNRFCVNYDGKVKLISKHKGILNKVLLQVRQVYEKFEASSIVEADDARLEYFSKKVFPKIKDSLEGGTMVFMSSYFEFVRIRNFLRSQNASFCLLGEYTTQRDISRARLWFYEGKRKLLLYTERAHFYHRYKIRGIKNLVIYSLPERKEFYPEIVNMLEGSKSMSCSVLFSRFDLYKLERIVGTAAAKRMITSDKSTFVFF